MKTFLRHIYPKLLFSIVLCGLMYLMWQDTMMPAAQKQAIALVYLEFWLFYFGLVFLYQSKPQYMYIDRYFPPLIAFFFALTFWHWYDGRIMIYTYAIMLFTSIIFSAARIPERIRNRFSVRPFSWVSIVIIAIFVPVLLISYGVVTIGFHSFPDILFIPYGLFLLLISYVVFFLFIFLYPIYLIAFFDAKRGKVSWGIFTLTAIAWVYVLFYTYPIRHLWGQVMDPCYLEDQTATMNIEYTILEKSRRIVCIMPEGEGTFSTATRHEATSVDGNTFEILKQGYGRDKNHVYYGETILDLDPAKIEIDYIYITDGSKAYERAVEIPVESMRESLKEIFGEE